jgi:predicted nucleotidyltransferase
MNPKDPNVLLVELVVQSLGPLCERFVFLGGSATGLLITDDARPPVRATKDVDLITELASLASYYELQTELTRLGFREDVNSGVTCRWRIGELLVDVMPTREVGLGFENRWYPLAAQQATRCQLPSGAEIRLVSPPLFIATKLEAFHGRGMGDYGASHDMEDIVTVVDGRPELVGEIAPCDSALREYIVDEVDALLGDERFVEALSWHFAGDEANQARVPELIRRLRAIAGI